MKTTFLSASNTSSATGQTLGLDPKQNIQIMKIIIGSPVSSGNLWFFHNQNAGVYTSTTGLAMKLTLGSAIPTTQTPIVIDLTDNAANGMVLSMGGAFYIDQTMQVTVLWDEVETQGGTG